MLDELTDGQLILLIVQSFVDFDSIKVALVQVNCCFLMNGQKVSNILNLGYLSQKKLLGYPELHYFQLPTLKFLMAFVFGFFLFEACD